MGVINSVQVFGDSFSDPTFSGDTEWPQQLDIPTNVDNRATSGDQLTVHIEPNFAADIATRHPRCDFVIIQGGINDFNADKTAATVEAAVQSIITTAQNAGLGIIILGVSPWGGSAFGTAPRLAQAELYNTWLAAQVAAQGITYVDIWTSLTDGGDPESLQAGYDYGDGIHLSQAGQDVVASLVNAEIPSFFVTVADVANEFKRWRGAVEPAETGASGNEIQRWRGAIEPAFNPSADALIGGPTRSITRTLTRGVTEGWDWGA